MCVRKTLRSSSDLRLPRALLKQRAAPEPLSLFGGGRAIFAQTFEPAMGNAMSSPKAMLIITYQ